MEEINVNNPLPVQRGFNPKIILLILGVAVLGELIFAVVTLTKGVPPVGGSRLTSLNKANIALLLPKSEYKVGETLAIKIRVDTNGNKTSGTDVLLRFDPKIFEASGDGVITKGTIYQDYPVASVDPKVGLITISGISPSKDSGFKGAGILATVNLKAKASGQTKITLDFTNGSSKDTNILDAGSSRDLLQKVIPLSLTIK